MDVLTGGFTEDSIPLPAVDKIREHPVDAARLCRHMVSRSTGPGVRKTQV